MELGPHPMGRRWHLFSYLLIEVNKNTTSENIHGPLSNKLCWSRFFRTSDRVSHPMWLSDMYKQPVIKYLCKRILIEGSHLCNWPAIATVKGQSQRTKPKIAYWFSFYTVIVYKYIFKVTFPFIASS